MYRRPEVLALYRRIIQLSKGWKAQNPENTAKEREYILKEARRGFKEHKSEIDPQKVRELISATEKRLEIACHYRIPYDRPHYLPPSTSYGRFFNS